MKGNPKSGVLVYQASTSGIFTIKLYCVPNESWVYDMGYGAYICNTTQGLKRKRKLKHRDLNLYVGNGMRAAVEAIGSFDLILPNGLVIVLDNCHYAPSITRDMQNLYPNVSSIYIVSNKRAKLTLDSTYLWHCRLDHVNKKHIKKLQCDGILQPTNDESFDKCKSCISGKMARKPFPHQVEIAKELLGLIHADLCGPFRTVSREGASYFVSFIDDFSRYGYAYLMKHKHESDRGGKYLSHEFIDHMKSCGIVSQLTPPYTPKHNRVSERRNQTLLEMVRSMMNSTTLPNSFWGHALEFATRILNMEMIGYYFYNPHENRIFVTCYAEFFENSLNLEEASGSYGLLEASESDVVTGRHCTCLFDLDLCFLSPSCLSRFQQKPGEAHWTAVKTILKYLRNTKDMVLVYGRNAETELKVTCYTDAGFQTDKDDTKSQTGYGFILNDEAVD
nr:hypothetical protein [Tanacetum cinerariifolium]